MSTAIEVEQELHNWLCTDDCICQPRAQEIPVSHKWQLMKVIMAQSEECAEGWHQVFCVETDSHMETAPGSLDAFAEMLLEMGWAAESAERGSAICSACANQEPTLTEREIWEDQACYAARKGE